MRPPPFELCVPVRVTQLSLLPCSGSRRMQSLMTKHLVELAGESKLPLMNLCCKLGKAVRNVSKQYFAAHNEPNKQMNVAPQYLGWTDDQYSLRP